VVGVKVEVGIGVLEVVGTGVLELVGTGVPEVVGTGVVEALVGPRVEALVQLGMGPGVPGAQVEAQHIKREPMSLKQAAQKIRERLLPVKSP
jgi:hypothetical protein